LTVPQNDIINLALTFHASVLACAIAAYYKYGDRTEVFSKSLQGTDLVLVRIRQKITEDLTKSLKPVFESAGSVPTLIVPDSVYLERSLNPVGSERYLEGIREFVEHSSDSLSTYRSVFLARHGWCVWARVLSWSILILAIWQAAATGFIAFGCTLGEIQVPSWIIKASFLPTALASFSCFSALPFLLFHHDRISGFRERYDIH
jgi:hypothetical protein